MNGVYSGRDDFLSGGVVWKFSEESASLLTYRAGFKSRG